MKPAQTYWICFTPRTGSTYLCDLLEATGLAGVPREWFWYDSEPGYPRSSSVKSYAEYLDRAMHQGTTENEVFGTKMDNGIYLEHFQKMLGTVPAFEGRSFDELVNELFPNLKFIWLTRKDEVRQAVSWWRAIRSAHWHSWQEPLTNTSKIAYSFDAIDNLVHQIRIRRDGWTEQFPDFDDRSLRVVYEDLAADPADDMERILGFLGIEGSYDLDPIAMRSKPLSDSLNDEWVERYRREKAISISD